MNLTLYTNNSDNNVVDKDLTQQSTITGTARGEMDILNPVITLETTSPLNGINYCYIQEFDRYYYITNITKTREGLTRIACRVDVLKTYADQIRAQRAIVARQENQWNLYLDDGTFKTYNNPLIITKAFPSGFSGMSYVLVVAGGQ